MWVITEQYLDDTKPKKTELGPFKGDGHILKKMLKEGKAVEFKLFDDDKELYFRGIIDNENFAGEFAFDPLDWAEPLYGCTEMQYHNGNKWEIL